MKEHNLNPVEFDIDEIISIELVGERDTIDIEVEDTHMFFVNDIYSHNSSLDDEIIEAGRIAESYNKIMIADFVISLQRKTKDKLAHTGRVHVIKNRFGPDGFTFPSKMNAANGTIQLFEEKSDDGKKTTKETENGGKLQRMKIGEKVNELKTNERSKKFDELV